eukprot:scaffold9402_cov77-Cyclotella_meneghiniana.AAC.11
MRRRLQALGRLGLLVCERDEGAMAFEHLNFCEIYGASCRRRAKALHCVMLSLDVIGKRSESTKKIEGSKRQKITLARFYGPL